MGGGSWRESDNASVGLFTDSGNNRESEIQATRSFPTNTDQIGPVHGVLEDLGVREGKLRELYYKGYKTSRQQLTGVFGPRPSVQGAGPKNSSRIPQSKWGWWGGEGAHKWVVT